MVSWRCLGLVILSGILMSCDDASLAPVIDIAPLAVNKPSPRKWVVSRTYQPPPPAYKTHQVKVGETLYEVAWQYGMDYRRLAAMNHITKPFALAPGQILKISAQASPIPIKFTFPTGAEDKSNITIPAVGWMWPAEGKLVKNYSQENKGIDIEGKAFSPVYAALNGEVVYSGNGLRGYGNLIILKHNHLYLSAYANNRSLYVREGQWVKKGQKIAEMGTSARRKPTLHFEIRRAGQPVDPLPLLAASKL